MEQQPKATAQMPIATHETINSNSDVSNCGKRTKGTNTATANDSKNISSNANLLALQTTHRCHYKNVVCNTTTTTTTTTTTQQAVKSVNFCINKFEPKNNLKYPGDLNRIPECPVTPPKLVFNGTYPIDNPMSSRFVHKRLAYNDDHDYYYERDEDDDDDDDEDDEDDDEDGDEDDEEDDTFEDYEIVTAKQTSQNFVNNDIYENRVKGYSLNEIINDKNIKINFSKMKEEYDRSFRAFDQMIERKNRNYAKTFNIDAPIE